MLRLPRPWMILFHFPHIARRGSLWISEDRIAPQMRQWKLCRHGCPGMLGICAQRARADKKFMPRHDITPFLSTHLMVSVLPSRPARPREDRGHIHRKALLLCLISVSCQDDVGLLRERNCDVGQMASGKLSSPQWAHSYCVLNCYILRSFFDFDDFKTYHDNKMQVNR
jgi:hypothetical protein